MNKVNNGRVDIKSPNTSSLFEMYDKIPANQCATFRNATEGLWDETILSNAFFSQENIKILQNGIRAGVYKRSNEWISWTDFLGNDHCYMSFEEAKKWVKRPDFCANFLTPFQNTDRTRIFIFI